MLELLAVLTFFGYIYYLRNYADLRSASEKEEEAFSQGIRMYREGAFEEAYQYFDQIISKNRRSAVAHLYRGLSQKERQNRQDAWQDMQTAASLDDELYTPFLEMGKVNLEDGDAEAALSHLNRAVAKAQDTSPEPYRWRAQAYLALGRQGEAQEDLAAEKEVRARLERLPASAKPQAPFVDKKLIASLVMVFFTSVLLTMVIQGAESVHLPYFVAVAAAIAIGFAEPRKGWLLALVQCVLVWTGYYFFTPAPESSGQTELENFALYGSLMLTFVASFLGGFMKRALSMQ